MASNFRSASRELREDIDEVAAAFLLRERLSLIPLPVEVACSAENSKIEVQSDAELRPGECILSRFAGGGLPHHKACAGDDALRAVPAPLVS